MSAGELPSHRATSFLIDLDGTLIDSSPLHDAAYRDALGRFRPDLLERYDYDAMRGRTTEDSLVLLGVSDPNELAEIAAAKRAGYRARAAAGVEPLPGAIELLETLRSLGRRAFVVTSGSAASTDVVLGSTGIGALVEGVVTADDVTEAKPSPEPFVTCCERFGVIPTHAAVVEDALAGVQGARAAGIATIGVHDPTIATAVGEFFPTLFDLRLAVLDGAAR